MKNTFGDKALNFFKNLNYPQNIPGNISTMNPYENKETQKVITQFYKKYFNDKNKRIFIVGINPGRFGGGITGIAFTDPINLEEYCGIKNTFDKKPELSSRFVYKLIDSYGGAERFYSRFFVSALYPLALIKEEKNYNYYDSKEIYNSLKPEITKLFKQQIEFGAESNVVICLGKKNEKYLREINKEIKHFKEIITFDHPRYIMQYKFKSVNKYVENYIKILKKIR